MHAELGVALFKTGAADEGIVHLRKACGLAPHSARTWFNLGEALKQDARLSEAADALQHAIGLDPSLAAGRLSLARVQASLGRIDAAARELREILRREPTNAEAWFGLSNLNTIRFSADDVARIRETFALAAGSPGQYEMAGFSLAKALEDQGAYAEAFEVFRVANAARRKRVRWDAEGEHERIDAILRVCANWDPPPQPRQQGEEVIFIASIPRSGSTLVEQILASHPDVEGANEINDLAVVVETESRLRHAAFPLWLPATSAEDWQRLGREYLSRTTRWRERKPRFTDKNMASWYLAGAALAMLPAARVAIVHRDPLETCLACYRQWFEGDAGLTYDLDEMADYCIDFTRLSRFWMEKFPDRVFDLEYEALLAEPESTIRRLLAFCGLPFDQACLDFHGTERAVLSAPSAAQVRQPLRRDTARVARYGDKLDHVRQRLRDAGLAAGGR
jgi:tetratricopeptide (TPR) repeat protein